MMGQAALTVADGSELCQLLWQEGAWLWEEGISPEGAASRKLVPVYQAFLEPAGVGGGVILRVVRRLCVFCRGDLRSEGLSSCGGQKQGHG